MGIGMKVKGWNHIGLILPSAEARSRRPPLRFALVPSAAFCSRQWLLPKRPKAELESRPKAPQLGNLS